MGNGTRSGWADGRGHDGGTAPGPAAARFEYWQAWDALTGSALGPRPGALRGDLRRYLRQTQRAATDGGEDAVRVRINAALAVLYLGDPIRAATSLTGAVAIARLRRARWEEGYAAYALGMLHRFNREAGPAAAWLESAERIFAECADPAARAFAHLALTATLLTLADASQRPAARPAEPADALASLTRREREVATLLATGLTNRQIGERMAIAERTVDTHVHRILVKLNCATRVQVALLAATGSRAPAPGPRGDQLASAG